MKLRSKEVAWLLAMWLVCTACNLFKPFHIDDTAYVRIAEWIGAHPLHPMRGVLNWTGVDEPFYRILHPHLCMYVLAAWGKVFGFTPPSLHAVQSIACLGCIFLLYRLFSQFVPRSALWATAVVVLGPAFLVEQNLMIDVPLLFTWLLFFYALVCEVGSPYQTRRYAIAGAACSAALLTKYSSVILLPIFLFSLVWERRRKQAWTVLLPIGTLIAWSAFNYLDFGGFHLLVKSAEGQHHSLLRFGVTWLVTLGGLTPLGIAGIFKYAKNRQQELTFYAALFLSFFGFLGLVIAHRISSAASDRILGGAFVLNGAAILMVVAQQSLSMYRSEAQSEGKKIERTSILYLLLWLVAGTLFYVVLAPFIAARHVLLTLPPITLLCILFWRQGISRTGKACSLVLTIFISSGLCLSDFRFASFQRDEAPRLQAALPAAGNWWTNGHLGWMYYAQQRGFRIFDRERSVLHRQDYFVVPSAGLEDISPELLPYLRLIQSDLEQHPLWSALCTGRPARLYRSNSTYGAWSVSADCTSRFDIYQVIVDRPAGPSPVTFTRH